MIFKVVVVFDCFMQIAHCKMIYTLHCPLQQAVVDGLGLHLCVYHQVEVGGSQKAAMRQHSKVQSTHGTKSTFTHITYVSLSVATGILTYCGFILLVLTVLALVSDKLETSTFLLLHGTAFHMV